MGKPHFGLVLNQVYPSAPYLDHYYFLFTLMTYLTIYQQLLSSFSIVQNVNTSASHLNSDLSKISNWAFQWKMSFNPDPSKQAQEVISLVKSKRLAILPFISIINQSNKSLLKSIWD